MSTARTSPPTERVVAVLDYLAGHPRGRFGLSDLATKKVQREWLPRQLVPEQDSLLLGLPTGPGNRTLQLANPGTDVVRAQVRIVTGDTSFVPAGLKPVTIAPGATANVTPSSSGRIANIRSGTA